jgi:hypothetical protein
MNPLRVLLSIFAVLLLGVTLLPGAQADTWDKKTVVTFSQSVEVPGKILPAGSYTFKLLDSPSDRHIVQIFDADGTHLITTILAINNYRLQPTGDTVMMFSERPADSPDALRAWFYPGDNFGQEFVYPKHRAFELAQRIKANVPAVAADVDDTTIKTTPIVAMTPEEKEVEVESRPAPAAETPAPVAATPTPAPTATVTPTPVPVSVASKTEELPQTASSMPLIALLGGLSISLALGLKLILKLVS